MNFMDATTRYYAAVSSTKITLTESLMSLETVWLAPFWPSTELRGDAEFSKDVFTTELKKFSITLCPSPPRRHSKNVLESNHGVIRSIFLWLINASNNLDPSLATVLSVKISNDLYGWHLLSEFESANCFTRSNSEHFNSVPPEFVEAQLHLEAKRNLDKILCRKNASDIVLTESYLVKIYVKIDRTERGKWSSPLFIFSFDRAA